MALLDAYTQLLDAMRLKVTEDGFIKNGDDENVFVAKKSLVLPVPAQLAVPDWSQRIAFNPFRENSLQSTPPAVTEYIRNRFIEHLNIKILWMLEHLVSIAGDQATHKKLDPEQANFLTVAKDVDENFVNLIHRLADKISKSEDTTSGAIHIFSMKNGVIGEKKYKRSATVSFPIYQSVKEGDKQTKIFGITGWRPKDRKMLAAILEYIFPDIDKPHSYSKGSDSGICPYLDSLMQAVGHVIEAINNVVETFRSTMDDDAIAIVETPVDWYEAFQDLSAYQTELHMLPVGGEAHKVISEPVQATTALANTAPAVQTATAIIGGQPVVLTLAQTPSGSVILPSANQAVPLGASNNTGPVNLAAAIAANPALAAQANAGMMQTMPQLAEYYRQIQAVSSLQQKQNRWAPGAVASASSPQTLAHGHFGQI